MPGMMFKLCNISLLGIYLKEGDVFKLLASSNLYHLLYKQIFHMLIHLYLYIKINLRTLISFNFLWLVLITCRTWNYLNSISSIISTLQKWRMALQLVWIRKIELILIFFRQSGGDQNTKSGSRVPGNNPWLDTYKFWFF